MKQISAIAGALALAFGAQVALAATPPKAPPKASPKPVERADWFRAGPDGSLDEAKQAWEAYKQAYAGDCGCLDHPFNDFVVKEGPYLGRWEVRRSQDGEAIAALHLRFPAAPPYTVQVRVLCGRDEAACASLRADASSMDPPRPDRDELVRDWHRVLANERCDEVLPDHREAPRYPREEERRGIEGVVTLGFVFNSCGRVRDVWIAKSSGNRNLDRAAMHVGQRWTLTPPDARGGEARNDISFKMDDPAPAAASSVQ